MKVDGRTSELVYGKVVCCHPYCLMYMDNISLGKPAGKEEWGVVIGGTRMDNLRYADDDHTYRQRSHRHHQVRCV